MFANRLHVRDEFTNTKRLVKKSARIESSSICCQQFANLFAECFCAVHTGQLEFANFSLPCEGRLRLLRTISLKATFEEKNTQFKRRLRDRG